MFNFLFSKRKEKKIITKDELFGSKFFNSEYLLKNYSFSFGVQIVKKDNEEYILVGGNKNYDYLISPTEFIDHLKENLKCNFIVDDKRDILMIYFVFCNNFIQI